MTDSCDSGYGAVQTTSCLQEIRYEAQFCEQRGWTVAMEDEYAEVAESMFHYDDHGAGDSTPTPYSTTTLHNEPQPRTFRLLHLFSGFRRPRDLEWWASDDGSSCGSVVNRHRDQPGLRPYEPHLCRQDHRDVLIGHLPCGDERSSVQLLVHCTVAGNGGWSKTTQDQSGALGSLGHYDEQLRAEAAAAWISTTTCYPGHLSSHLQKRRLSDDGTPSRPWSSSLYLDMEPQGSSQPSAGARPMHVWCTFQEAYDHHDYWTTDKRCSS